MQSVNHLETNQTLARHNWTQPGIRPRRQHHTLQTRGLRWRIGRIGFLRNARKEPPLVHIMLRFDGKSVLEATPQKQT